MDAFDEPLERALERALEIVVIGGGAAGIFGAIAAARTWRSARVTVLEAGPDFLSKVLISGGGRCNVTHACFEPKRLIEHYPRGDRALLGPFQAFQPRDTIDWFAAEGVRLKTEADGRIFPTTDRSETIAEALLGAARSAGVVLRSRSAVITVESLGEGQADPLFRLVLRSGEVILADRLLLATGGSRHGHTLAARLGHTIAPAVPSLFTFNVNDPRLTDLAGLAVELAQIRLVPNHAGTTTKSNRSAAALSQTGPLLITHWGLSGPAVLKLSAWAARSLHECHYQASLIINWLPEHRPETVRSLLEQAKTEAARKTIWAYSPVHLPRRLWQRLTAAAGVAEGDRWADLAKTRLTAIGQELSAGQFAIVGKGQFKDEFVTCGGVILKEVQTKTWASRVCPGLFFAGEILDIDGITGGFNFQSAWTTAWLAGRAIGQTPPPT